MAVTRDEQHVLREYDREKWAYVRDFIRRLREQGETSLSRIHRIVSRDWMADTIGYKTWKSGPNPAKISFGQQTLEIPFEIACGGAYAMVADIIAQLGEDADAVIELGSGWGRVLLDIWLGGGPRQALYVAAEFTPTGRSCTSELAALDPKLRLQTCAFDYYKPNLSRQLAKVKRAVVFSHHSVEQIPQLPRALLDDLCDLADELVCVHFEPVGFQIVGSDRAMSTLRYAETHDYNRNLYPLLLDAEREGVLSIHHALPDVVGVSTSNPVSVIEWSKRNQR